MPEHPDGTRQGRVQGLVTVQAVIDEHGSVVCPRLLKGLSPALNEAVLNTLRHWAFEPATRNGEPVAVVYELTFSFH